MSEAVNDGRPQALGAAARQGSRWTAIQFGAARLLTIPVFLVLARLLPPGAFGLVALASVFVLLMQVLVDGGFSQALIQRPKLEPEHLNVVFWTSMATGIGLASLLFALAGPLADITGQPQLRDVIR